MKKWMKMMAMALMAVAMTVGFAACSSSDDDNNGDTPGSATVVGGKVEYNITIPEDLLAVANVNFVYKDENGNDKTESVTSKDFKKEIIYNKLPATAYSYFEVKLKKNYTHKETYDFSYEKTIYFGTISSDNKFIKKKGSYSTGGLNEIADAKIADYIKKNSKNMLPRVSTTITKDM